MEMKKNILVSGNADSTVKVGMYVSSHGYGNEECTLLILHLGLVVTIRIMILIQMFLHITSCDRIDLLYPLHVAILKY